MDRLPLYDEHARKLIASGKAYRCYCTREELEAARVALKVRDPKATFHYPGTCRNRKDEPDRPFVVRLRVPEQGVVRYVDRVFGEVVTPNAAQQDFVLLRSDGVPLYNFGAVVDDLTMGITLVARGRDHMVNTPPQILLYEALGHQPPDFAHLPMMLAPSGEKLSKRHGAVSVGEYREQGYTPAAVLNYLARFGWSHGDQEVFSLDELVDAFDWKHCNRGDGKFDAKKFLAINHEHLKTERLTPTDVYAGQLPPFLARRGLPAASPAELARAVPLIRERATTFVDAADRLDFVFRDPPVFDEEAVKKFLVAANAARLREMAGVLEAVTTWSVAELDKAFAQWFERAGLTIKDVAQPARVALTGRTASPGLYEVMETLGRERTVARIRAGATSSS
jgi:glutamyl-tRNA synthetase